jgi:heptosyltransferase-2
MSPFDLDPAGIARILIREVNWVGDAVLTLPALEAVRRRFARATITVLAKGWVAGLFRGHPSVDGVLAFHPEGEHGGVRGRLRLVQAVRALHADLAVILPNSFESALIPRLAGIPRRVGCASDGRGCLLSHRLPRNASGGARHQVHHYLRIVRALGAEGEAVPRLAVLPEARENADRLLRAAGIAPEDRIICVNPGAIYGSAKQWGVERFASAGDRLAADWDARPVLVGSAREAAILGAVADRMRRRAVVLGGRTDLPALAALSARARLLLTNDTGAMHVAAAVGTPVVAVFGPTDAEATGPLGPRVRIVRRAVPCSPCLLRECPIDHRCMTAVTVAEVVEAAKALLGDTGRDGR